MLEDATIIAPKPPTELQLAGRIGCGTPSYRHFAIFDFDLAPVRK
jgi:hypothetical protein